MWIDSHCHLEPEDFCCPDAAGGPPRDERPEVLARARAAGVQRLIVIGSGHGIAEVRNAIAFAQADPQLFAAIGIHPHDATIVEAPVEAACESTIKSTIAAPTKAPIQARTAPPTPSPPSPVAERRPAVPGPRGAELWAAIEHLAMTEPRVVAVGETGLDYFYKNSPPAHQQALLRRFVRLSARIGKPLSLHIRDAHADAQRIITEEGGAPAGGVVHCFTGGPDEAQSWLALGFHISLSGIVTFKSAAAIQAAARLIPAERLLLETDCPYLAPVPLRGQRNEPAYLVHTAAFVARLRGISPAELAATTTRAAADLFRLPAPDRAGTASANTTSASTTSASTTPAGTTPAGTTPASTTPAGTTPAGTTPAGTTPAGTAPAGTAPAGTTPAGATPAALKVGPA